MVHEMQQSNFVFNEYIIIFAGSVYFGTSCMGQIIIISRNESSFFIKLSDFMPDDGDDNNNDNDNTDNKDDDNRSVVESKQYGLLYIYTVYIIYECYT